MAIYKVINRGILALIIIIIGVAIYKFGTRDQEPQRLIKGPFQNTRRTHFTSASYFFIDNSAGKEFDLAINCLSIGTGTYNTNSSPNPNDAFPRMLIRVFDPKEYLIHRDQITSPELALNEKLPSFFSIKIPSSQRGIIQVSVISGSSATFDLVTKPPLPFGIMNSIQVITPPKNPIEQGYIYIPKGAQALRLEPVACKLTLWDENDQVVFQDKGEPVAIKKTGVIWKISIQPENWPGAKVYATGFPVIICPDKKTAKHIRGSYEQLDDGTIVAHKFQVRLDRLVRKQFNNPQRFQLDPINSFEKMIPLFITNPEKYCKLVTGYLPILPHQNFWLNRQVLDPKSPYFGGIHSTDSYYAPKPKLHYIPGNPLNSTNVFEQLPDQPLPLTDDFALTNWVTAYSPWGISGVMGMIYNLDKEINPYYHNTNLLNRIIIAASRDLMLFKEDELVIPQNSVDWPGCLAFVFEFAQTKAYGEMGQVCKELYPDIYREWTEGIKRYADRLSYSCAFYPANQGAHTISAFWRVYQGTADPYYRELAIYNLKRFCATLQKPAGYFAEGYGPCASYNGLTLTLLAKLYLESQLDWLKEAIRRNYDCFNHTVATEPSGRLIGVTDLNHRVHRPWTETQSGAGREMMRAYLKEAGIWYRKPMNDQVKNGLIKVIQEKSPKIPFPFNDYVEDPKRIEPACLTGMTLGEFYYNYFNPNVMTGGVFPCEEIKPYIRNLGDEFICVRQPKYYVLIYVGKPGIGPKETVKPMENWIRTGGGISLLWTPNYYVAMAGQGWNSYCHHGLIADLGNDKVCSADYYSVNFTLDAEKKTLLVNGKLKNTPLKYSYYYTFEPDQIHIRMTVEAESDFKSQGCYLQFPLFAAKEREFKASIPEKGTKFLVSDNTGAGVGFIFEQDMVGQLGHTSELKIIDYNYIIKQLKIILPSAWKSGQKNEINYRIVPE